MALQCNTGIHKSLNLDKNADWNLLFPVELKRSNPIAYNQTGGDNTNMCFETIKYTLK